MNFHIKYNQFENDFSFAKLQDLLYFKSAVFWLYFDLMNEKHEKLSRSLNINFTKAWKKVLEKC